MQADGAAGLAIAITAVTTATSDVCCTTRKSALQDVQSTR